MTSFVLIGTSISEDDDCTSHCYGKNLTCSTELTTLLVDKNINCTNSSRTSWSEDYHPSYNTTSHSCEGYEKINNTKACNKVNISSSNIKRICYCLRPSKTFAIYYLLHLLVEKWINKHYNMSDRYDSSSFQKVFNRQTDISFVSIKDSRGGANRILV